ncbi:MAG: efflux transporter outer membrane subunit [Betaproteobacteria bacterium]|nr:efflux transporter outer membrane subunit [Betaproteobacteria bacterium]
MKARLAAAVAAFALGGCTLLGPDYKRPQIDLPNRYPEAEAGTAAAVPVPANWWQLYEDPLLDKLVAAGLVQNTDVKLSVARIEEAEALLREAAATRFPQVDASASSSRSRASTRSGALPSGATAVRGNLQLSANTTFEIDFWGRLRRLREAARAQYIGTRYARDVVALTLAAAISQTYFTVRSLDAQLIVSEETLKAAEDSVEIARRRAEAGVVSDLDVSQAKANRAQLAAQIKDLRRLRAAAVHQLGVLTGVLDLNLVAGDLRRLPVPPLPPAGLPSTLLERRPDVREAEAALVAANAQIGVARAAQFPTFSITGALGVQSAQLSNLFSSGAGIWSVGLGAVGPIFDAGRYAARTDQAEARARQAALSYERTVQNAFREVADALSNVRLALEAEQDLRERVDQARNTLRLATLRYESGYSAYLEVLDAQRTLNDAQLALVRNRQSFLGFSVDLMNALGGGWVPYETQEGRFSLPLIEPRA